MLKKKKYIVAVVGATGAVGNEMIATLVGRDFPVERLRLFASERSEGKIMEFKDAEIPVEALNEDSFNGIDIAFFSAGAERSKIWAPVAAKSGCVVVDNSSQWRMDPEVPLVVPEVNPHDLKWHKGIIANPNCSTIQMVVVLKPLHDSARIKRVVVTTFQSVSGTGQKAMDELLQQTTALLNFKEIKCNVYPYQIAFNVIPHIDKFLENGYTKEEMKMVNETKKILGDTSIRITATTVRVPVFRSHSESLNIETEKKLTADEVRAILSEAPGVIVYDAPDKNIYPLPIDAAGKDETYVGRIREDESIENGINMWIVADNLRKGAALNAVQIAEKLIEMA
ncbi:MAG: aspartate-semialdehyde dehydrogenase [Nitrospirae bacterium CG_4_10_14_0_8_um_filter_41_23]|nr:aspartate-semialdehyde dehydrogenase [Nitrospirota bacterium]OIP61174.1 MAG: aspartate-semialdehyde dehydrogenase [Nitrospirae bacterium CG2_30_41_42]PIQ94415.1 MAG: aspartate-semialdehyde dehydrogenase [Nitrospirae bacterium CG11_big_fil_rev_8_21_14_0_20_41_14]PIV41806.1 MAG: aspartate-semialdehyde dehydrogenase [Nitrospirae bacterium CG02_land_8_20_14_3_00_41_53]PIW86325.1 MAG: aspartate-semialdehyde dehydrogenase [Nitrospirae bacterium CG_4_8_14_3_um_filter_41_47]PIY86939.1 MAG: aspartat